MRRHHLKSHEPLRDFACCLELSTWMQLCKAGCGHPLLILIPELSELHQGCRTQNCAAASNIILYFCPWGSRDRIKVRRQKWEWVPCGFIPGVHTPPGRCHSTGFGDVFRGGFQTITLGVVPIQSPSVLWCRDAAIATSPEPVF